jgi:SSS family solute:Na+ symporter
MTQEGRRTALDLFLTRRFAAMNHTLLAFVILYLVGTMGIGIYAGTRIKNTTDFAIAGRSLPLAMVITTTFATWFGAETVMGIPARFVKDGGLSAVIEDPFGASMCLVLVGAFFASRLYKMSLLTIGDFYRHRFGEGVEVFCSVAIILSYLGWVAAQITALGLVFSVLSGGAIAPPVGMAIGTSLVLIYVLIGGMLAVAWTDFIQMIVLVVGLSLIAVLAGEQAGGPGKVLDLAVANDWFKILPEATPKGWLFFVGTAVTMMLGSIPQQDVFQRVMSAKDSTTARNGAMIGGVSYLAFAFVPMFIVASATLIMPAEAKELLANDPQKVLPTLILTKMPLVAQIFFFGALVSAIKSTSSATLLAPSTSFVENILKNIHPGMSDRQVLLSLRITIFVFTGLVLTYAIKMQGTAIYDMVSSAYQVTLVAAFVPLSMGLYWQRATTQGAILSIVGGIGCWAPFVVNSVWGDGSWSEAFPGQLAGLIAALAGMVLGSLLPQIIPDHRARKAHMA